jgi:S-formylglutathione hydrolase
METLTSNRSFGGWHRRYRHQSEALDCAMEFAVYLPPQAAQRPVPALWWLSGLTCTDENFMQKAGAQKRAAELGLALICPDTSPRGTELPGEHDDWDFGSGAGFYVNATQRPWSQHYRMFDYVTAELPDLVEGELPLNGKRSIAGHSMGGHGALICALKKPERYRSVSAFAPICHPSHCAWGRKAFSHYLGTDPSDWRDWDAVELIRRRGSRFDLLVDQGQDDGFLQQEQLMPEALQAACRVAGVGLTLRFQAGHDHSYFFIASFIDDHLDYHWQQLHG